MARLTDLLGGLPGFYASHLQRVAGPGPYEARQSDQSALAQSMAADVDPLNAALADYWRGLSGQGQGSGWFGMNTVPQELNRLGAFSREAAGTENPLTGPEGMAAMRALFDSPLAPGFGAIGTVGGVGAKTADLVALARAQDMAAAGEDAAKIVRETGWWTGPDGKWRFEIDDSGSRLTPKATDELAGADGTLGGTQATAPGVIAHNDLYAAYPELRRVGVDAQYDADLTSPRGAYIHSDERPRVQIEANALEGGANSVRGIGLHEFQHNVQKLEDFARGGSMAQFSEAPARRLELEYGWSKAAVDKLKSAIDEGADQALIRDPSRNGAYTMIQGRDEMARLYDELSSRLGQLDAEYKAADPFEQYRRLYGEVEARAVQARMNMTPEERRLRPFWLDADVPQDQWIVRGQDGGVSMSTGDVAQGAARLADDLPQPGIGGYHGSPHTYKAERLVQMPDGSMQYIEGAVDQLPDVPVGATVIKDFPLGRQRLDKIGTGEGAQAYGHGLYFAEAEDVARSYRNMLPQDASPAEYLANSYVNQAGGDLVAARKLLARDRVRTRTPEGQEALSVLSRWAEGGRETPGAMYEVRINANPDDFLDWDKPLSEQPERVREAVLRAAPEWAPDVQFGAERAAGGYYPRVDLPDTGQRTFRTTLYATRQEATDAAKAALWESRLRQVGPEESARLRDAGLPGIKYLDAGSRSAGDGSRNYVVFDDKLIEILRRYGLLPPLAAGAAASLGGNEAEAGQ